MTDSKMNHEITPGTVVDTLAPAFDPEKETIFKQLKEMVAFIGPCDHDVGICYCELQAELEAAETIAKGLIATASMGLASAKFLEKSRSAVAALRRLGVPERSIWGRLVMYHTPAPPDGFGAG